MQHKKQHFIPQSYLKAWCDPLTPSNQEPYIWLVSKISQEITHKSPKNLFSQTDMYTVYGKNKERILELEFKLRDIESDFIQIRDNKIYKQKKLSLEDKKAIVYFITTTFTRTIYQKKEQKDIWEELLGFYKTQKVDMNYPELNNYVEQLYEQPMPFHMFNFINITSPILMQMNLAILQSNSLQGFITSDNPVIWIDPSIINNKNPITFFGIGSKDLEILMPLSPNFLLKLSWNKNIGYISVDTEPQFIDQINKLISLFSEEFIITNTKIFNPNWFES